MKTMDLVKDAIGYTFLATLSAKQKRDNRNI
jgi:hypothetical protein